jgi:hypothetical protein
MPDAADVVGVTGALVMKPPTYLVVMAHLRKLMGMFE